MENLESSLNIDNKRQNRLRNLGFCFHFGGEFALVGGIGATLTNLMINDKIEYKWLIVGAVSFLLTQPIAIHLGGMAMDKDDAFEKMKLFAHQYKEDKNKGRYISSFFEKQSYKLAKLYYNKN